MKTICLNLNIHRPYILKKYDFFDIGHNNFYFDDIGTQAAAEQKSRDFVCPMLDTVRDIIDTHGQAFKCSITVSGTALSIQEKCCRNVIERFGDLADTGCVEFVGMPYNHSLAALTDEDEFVHQVKKHAQELHRLIGVTPTTFRNTELIYTDKIGLLAYDMGFDTVLAEGTGPGVELKGPNFAYFNPLQPRQKVITRNISLSRILEDSLKDTQLFTPEYYTNKLYDEIDTDDEIIYIGINFDHMEGAEGSRSQIPDFIKKVIDTIIETELFEFLLPREAAAKHQPVAPYHAPKPISGMTRKHDLTPWQGNELQKEALRKIAALGKTLKIANNQTLTDIWERLQCSDYLYFMSTDHLDYKTNIFKTPYDAFISYMNVIDDLSRRIDDKIEKNNAENMSEQQIKNIISFYEKEIVSLRRKLSDKE